MTTGATGQLGLALPVQGELSGTWGDTVNNGITQYTNIAIAGTLTLTNDGAVTLANTTGDASASNITSTLTGAGTVTAQFAIVKVTGTLTTAKVVTGPSYSKTYTVVNSATGGIVTFKASGQTGVSIAVGETAFVYFNGTDYVKVVGTATAGAAGGSNTQVQFNSSGVLAGDADLTFDGTTLSTAGLTASGTVTLSGGTANGVAYLNGSKVVTSGSALTFDGSNLGVTASSSAGFVGLTTQNTSAGAGASSGLGINNDSTASTYLRTYGSGQTNTLLGSVIANYTALLSDGAASNGILFGTLTNKPIIFGQNNAESMRLTSTGLGIGTSSFSYPLTVSRATTGASAQFINSTSYGQIFITSSGTNQNGYLTINPSGTGSAVIQVGNTDRVTIDSSGNLGLGVTPSAWLSTYRSMQIGLTSAITGLSNDTKLFLNNNAYFSASSQWVYAATSPATQYQLNDGQHRWYNAPSGTAGNAITFTQAMTLDTTGNLGLGTTSPSARLSVSNSAGGNVASFTDTTSADLQINLTSGVSLLTPSTGILAFGTSSTERARFLSNGNFGLGTTTPDAKLQVVGQSFFGAAGAYVSIGSPKVVFYGAGATETSALWFQAGVGSTLAGFKASNPNFFITNTYAGNVLGTNGIVISQNGLVEIFTSTTVDAVATVKATSANYAAIINIEAQNDNGAIYNYIASNTTGVTQHWKISGGAATNTMAFSTGGSERMRISSVGNLGISTTATDFKVTTQGFAAYTNNTNNTDGSGDAQRNGIGWVATGGSQVLGSFITAANQGSWGSDITFFTRPSTGGNASERARITTTGELLVGTTTTPVAGYNCFSEAGADVQLILQRTGGADGYGGIGAQASYALVVYEGSSGTLTQRFYVTQAGATYNTTGTYGTISDIKIKENIQDSRGYLDDLCKVRIVKYSLKADAKSVPDKLGVIAQELEQIFPNMIEEQPDVVNGKEVLDTTTKTVKYSVFVPMLIKALQEQQAIIESLKARLDAANL